MAIGKAIQLLGTAP